ncbi:MAG TPA: Stp1/IreP family PP2C-type Ser/Thr phosphatase [Syntrophomonadaceae bacterium]|nr:Stp1/IreP family PP2C-type Ser/Thr phosphatase [Syntrophomonadaceae bacterium]
MKTIGLSDTGLKRKRNEDAFLIRNVENIFVVCDGMGGHKGGNIASNMAIQTIEKELEDGHHVSVEFLNRAIEKANLKIWQGGHDNLDWHEMGTTITIAKIDNMRLDICHVGDSRLYLIRKDEITQITKDHTLAEEMAKSGMIKSKQKSFNHVLTRALGISKDIEIDNITMDLYKDDTILLCTDGLSDMLSDQELLTIITKNDETKITGQNLIQAALTKGGYDNITLILVQINGR